MAPSPPPTGLLHQNSGTNILGGLPSRLVTEDTPPDMLAGSMDLRVTLPNKNTVKMSVERSTPMMDLLVHITTAHKVSPGGHVLQAIGERGVLPYKPSTPIGALDTWSIYVVPRHQTGVSTPAPAQSKRAPPKPLALQSQQPFEQTFRLQVRLPRNQLFVARLSPRTPLADILDHVCREKNLDPTKYELRHPVNTEQALQLSLSLADYRVTEIAVVPRGSRAPTELSSSDLPALQNSQRPPSTTSNGSAGGIFANMLKRTRSGGTNKEGSVSGDSLGGRSSSPARSDESAGRSVSPPGPGGLAPQQPPPPPRHRKGRAPKPPPNQPTVSSSSVKASSSSSETAAPHEDRTLVISHSRNSSDSSGYHEASVLSESPDNHHGRRLESPPDTLARDKPSKSSHSNKQQFSRSMLNLNEQASTSQQLNNLHSASTTSLANKKKRAPPPPPTIPEPAVDTLPTSSIVLEPARPNPAPRSRSRINLITESAAPTNLISSPPESPISMAPPPIAPRLLKKSSSSELKISSISRRGGIFDLVKKTTEKKKKKKSKTNSSRSSFNSSIGSSSSSVFGVGRSMLAMSNSQDLHVSSDEELDLEMFEGASEKLSDDEDVEATENDFHSLLGTPKRNSITQIIHKSNSKNSKQKAPAPKPPKSVGYRVRPKLDHVNWTTIDEPDLVRTDDGFTLAPPVHDDLTPDDVFGGEGSDSSDDQESTAEKNDDSAGEDDLDSAFQSVTDVLEEQLRAEAEQERVETERAEERAQLEQEEQRLAEIRAEEKRLAEQEAEEERRKADEERKKAEQERKEFEEERARLAQEREELARQRREQQMLEAELRERLQKELELKQKQMQEDQRREIERLQREQEELERELKEREQEKAERMKLRETIVSPPIVVHQDSEIPEWEYKLPAPPTAFRDKQVNNQQQNEDERRNSDASSNSDQNIEVKNKINAMLEYASNSDEESRPKVVEVRVKRSVSPPRVSVVPLRSAHSLYSLVHDEEQEEAQVVKAATPLRKTSSVADVSKESDDEARLQQLQQQFVQWQEQLITNQSVLQGHVNMPLQSLQVLREILPQMKQKMSEDAANEYSESSVNIRASTLPRAPTRSTEVLIEPPSISTTTLDRRSGPPPTQQQRYRPPTVNLSTWSERPKSEVIIKQDSDYRIGVGQLQARTQPILRSTEPKLKETTNLLSAVNREVVTRSNSWRSTTTTTTTVHKPSLVLIQNSQPANATELVRASNKPTVILRHQPLSLSASEVPTQQRRYTTLVGVNGAPQPTRTSFTNQHRITQASNPIVKGFTSDPIVKGFHSDPIVKGYSSSDPIKTSGYKKSNTKSFKIETEPIINKPSVQVQSSFPNKMKSSFSTPMPPPPPPVIRNVTQKRMNNPPPVAVESDRDQLMDAIKNFGGRSNLRKTRSMQM